MKKNYKKISIALILTICIFIFAACGHNETQETTVPSNNEINSEQPIVLKIGHIAPATEGSRYHDVSKEIKQILEEKTNGAYTMEIFPSSQLGGDSEMLESMQFGTLDMGVITSATITNFSPSWGVLDLPYIFSDWDHAIRFMNSDIGKELLKEGSEIGLINLGYLGRGFRDTTNSKKPIIGPGDFKGIKIRVIESPVYVDTFTALGANAQAMSWGEVFTAIQQGTIDGQENPITTIHEQSIYEVNKYISLTDHMFSFATIVCSEKTWNKLPEDIKTILANAAVEAQNKWTKIQVEEEQLILNDLVDKGMIVNECDKEGFRELVQNVVNKWVEKNGAKYVDGINALRE